MTGTGAAAGLAIVLGLGGPPMPEVVPGGAGAPALSADTLTLDEAMGTALRRNPDVQAALARQSRAHADRRAGWGAFLPTVDGGLAFSRSSFRTVTFAAPEGSSQRLEEALAGVRKSSSQSLSFQWSLLEGGRRFAGLAQSGAATGAADRRVTAAERRVMAAVKRSYYEAVKQQRLAEVAERQLEGRRQDLEMTRRRYELAAATRADLLGAEIEVGSAELAVLEARDAAAAAVRDLGVQMGVDGVAEETPLRDVPALPDAERLDPAALLRHALADEPELAALRADVSAASAALWEGRADYLPNVRLGFVISRSESLGPEGSFFVFDPSNRVYSFTVSLSWNLFDGFRREQRMAQASAAHREADAQLLRRELELEKEVRDLSEEIRRRARRLEIQRRTVELARERLAVAQEQYRLGAITFFDLQNAIRDITAAERQLIQEQYDYLKAWAGLEERVGEALP